MGHHALVFGASGILGWAVVDQILKNYPERGVYDKVTAFSNRPLSRDDSYWPAAGPSTPQLDIVSGIDLTKGTVEELREVFQRRIPDIGNVTHVYYFAYQFDPDFSTESEINLGMLQRGFVAVESLACKLEYVIFPTGTKGYGIHLPNQPYKAPFVEDTMNTIPHPWRDQLFYYVLRDEFDRLQKGKNWKWAEVRCGPVLGFVPHSNPYNLPGIYMNFLSLYKYMHEQGHPDAASAEVPFPAPPACWTSVFNDGYQDTFGQFSIHLCLNKDKAGTSELYNSGNESTPRSMAERWPAIASLFGLNGTPPLPKDDPAFRLPVTFVQEHIDQVKKLKKEKGIELQGVSLDRGLEGWMEFFDFNHDLDLSKSRKVGYYGEVPFQKAWKTVFDRYARANKAYYGAAVANGH